MSEPVVKEVSVPMWQAEDGSMFHSESDAISHVKLCRFCRWYDSVPWEDHLRETRSGDLVNSGALFNWLEKHMPDLRDLF